MWEQIYKGIPTWAQKEIASHSEAQKARAYQVIRHFLSAPIERQAIMASMVEPYIFPRGPIRELWQWMSTQPRPIPHARLAELPSHLKHVIQMAKIIPAPTELHEIDEIIRQMRECHQAMKMVAMAGFMAQGARVGATTATMAVVQDALRDITAHGGALATPARAGEVSRDLLDRETDYIPTGFTHLDRQIGGFIRGGLNIVGGRRKIGKTSFCTQLAIHLAHAGYRVMYYALEKGTEYIAGKMVCQLARVPARGFVARRLTNEEVERFKTGVTVLNRLPVFVFCPSEMDSAAKRAANLAVYIRHYAAQGYNIHIIDHVQKLSREYQGLSVTAEMFQNLATQENITIILASQMNEKEHVYGSQVPEQEADLFIMLTVADSRDRRLVKVPAARFAEGGMVSLAWEADYTRFGNHDGGDENHVSCPLDTIFSEVMYDELNF